MSEFDLITFVGISVWYIRILKCFRWVKIHYFLLNFCLWNTIKFEIFICTFTFYCNYFLLNFCVWNTIKSEIFICTFTFYCNDTRILGWFLYCSIYLAIGSSIWSIFTDFSWYFGMFRFETTLIKNLLRTSATLSFLYKIKSCSTNVIISWVEPFSEKKGLIDFQKALLSVTFSWSRLL